MATPDIFGRGKSLREDNYKHIINSDYNSSLGQHPETNLPDQTVAIDQLSATLRSNTYQYSDIMLSEILLQFLQIDIRQILLEHVRTLLQRLPPLQHIDRLPNCFALLRYLSKSTDFCRLIEESEVLQRGEFISLSAIDPDIQKNISKVFLEIIRKAPETIETLHSVISKPIVELITSPTIYRSQGLHIHLHLSVFLLKYIEQEKYFDILKVYTKFVHHTSSTVVTTCLDGIARVLGSCPNLIPVCIDHSFLSRLSQLGYQEIVDENNNLKVDDEVSFRVIVVLEHLISYSGGEIPDREEIFRCAIGLIVKGLKSGNTSCRSESLFSISIVICEHRTANEDDIQLILNLFLDISDTLVMKDKMIAANIIGNAFAFLSSELIEQMKDHAKFLDCLQDLLYFDNPESMEILARSLSLLALYHKTIFWSIFTQPSLFASLTEFIQLGCKYGEPQCEWLSDYVNNASENNMN